MEDWDEKRKKWLLHHLSFAAGVGDRVLLVTGSQATACSNPVGDHLLLRFFENKVDYCRLHGYDIFYNNLALHPKVTGAGPSYLLFGLPCWLILRWSGCGGLTQI
ncbi:hypothetical protein ACFX13_004317 [Malus domestica]